MTDKQLGEASPGLMKAMEDLMAKYFKEADERAEGSVQRLEKHIDYMHATLT